MYARYTYMQREVTVEIVSCDKRGSYIGDMTYESKDVTIALLREGVVYINEASIDFCPNATTLESCELDAKEAKKGFWKNQVAKSVMKEEVVNGEMDMMITHIKTGNDFYVNVALDQDKVLQIEHYMDSLPAHNDQPVLQPRKGGVYAYRDQSKWIRIRITSSKGSQHSGIALDKGFEVNTTAASLHAIDDAAIVAIPPLARECVLAAIEVPPSGAWKEESILCFEDLITTEVQHGRVVLRDAENRLVVFLYRQGEKKHSVNEMMIAEGWARIDRKTATKFAAYASILSSMEAFERDAKEDRIGMYVHGDIGFMED